MPDVQLADDRGLLDMARRVQLADPQGVLAVLEQEVEFFDHRLRGVGDHRVEVRQGGASVVAEGQDALAEERAGGHHDVRTVEVGHLILRRRGGLGHQLREQLTSRVDPAEDRLAAAQIV